MFCSTGASPQATADGETKAIVAATTAFVNSLSAAQREKIQFPFTPEKIAKAAIKGSYVEPSQGAGAVALLVSDRPDILEIDFGANGYYSYEVMDSCRPTAEIAVMGAEGAVKILYKKEIAAAKDPSVYEKKLVNEYREQFCSPYQAAKKAMITDVIAPAETRAVRAA